MDNELEQLKRQVQELQRWKESKERQQIEFPLDQQSKDVLKKDLIIVTGRGFFTRANGQIGAYFLETNINGKSELIGIYPPQTYFTSNSSANTLIMRGHGFSNDERVGLLTITGFPAPLIDGFPFWIVNATADTVQLSDTQGGSVINLTSEGSGYMSYF